MSKRRYQRWLAWIAVPPFLLLMFVVGLFVYMNATARPLHPDPQKVPSQAAAAPAPAWTGAVEQARQIAREALVGRNLPGLSAAVGIDGQIVWAEGFGWADLDTRAPVTPRTRFRTGGASLPLTSAAVGLLLEKNRLNLDADIQRYVPTFPEKQWPITLRQLMAHTAGIRQDDGDEEPLSVRCEQTTDGLRRFNDAPLLFEPDTTYRYSAYGWILVSAAVEEAAAEPFFTFMRTAVFTPLGLTETEPESPNGAVPDRATFYYPRFAGDPRYGPDPAREGNYSCFAGAGAFLSTPSDLARFAMRFDAGTLLQPATVKRLQTPQRLTSGDSTGYGLGWDVETVSLAGAPATWIGHEGEFFIGGGAALMAFPERGLVVAVMTNISFADVSAVALTIADRFAVRTR